MKSRKRSAANEALKMSEGPSKVVLSASDASMLAPDREIKIKKPVRLTRARAASIRRSIATHAPAAIRPIAAVRKEKTPRVQNILGEVTFTAGMFVGKTGLLLGKIKKSLIKT